MKSITAEQLRNMEGQEGLILQGCGGDLREWVDGINDMLTEAGILLDGTKFTADDCMTFESDGVTCLLFPFSDKVKLNMGKLAMWRLQTHDSFGGTWLSDYVPNRLGGFVNEPQQKPDCPLIGADSNVFNLMGIAARTLRENELPEQAEEMIQKVTSSGIYDEALGIISDYVNVTSAEDEEMEQEFGGM